MKTPQDKMKQHSGTGTTTTLQDDHVTTFGQLENLCTCQTVSNLSNSLKKNVLCEIASI